MPADQNASLPAIPYILAMVVDGLLLLAVAAVLLVALTGGTVFTIAGASVSVTTTGNPIAFGAALASLRYLWFQSIPFFGSRWRPAHLENAAAFVFARLQASIDAPLRRPGTLLILTLLISVILRLINAWTHPGFTTGDDVEIHEMTLGYLFREPWTVWNLRSALYPMSFVYPFQALASFVVDHGVRSLVFAGRLVVVAFATITVWLVYRVTLRLTNSSGTALLAAILLAASRLHLWFGSSELPRPVAAAFILAAFWSLIVASSTSRAAIAGVLVGVGGALRFGEFVFFAPAMVHLAGERRWRDALVMTAAGALSAAVSLGVADWLYWHQPFFSLMNAVDYTLVQGASSRGLQPAWYYFLNATHWTNFVFLAFGLAAIAATDRRITLWTWLPVLLLSLLPHKEARYVIAVLPFVCIAVAMTLANPLLFTTPRRKTLAVFALAVALVFELSNWRFRRSDGAVRLAQQIDSLRPSGVAAQQLWRFGGRLYLSNVNGPLVDIREPVDATQFLENQVQLVLLLRNSATPRVQDELMIQGYELAEALSTPQYVTFERR